MILLRSPRVYRKDLTSDTLIEHLFDWANSYPVDEAHPAKAPVDVRIFFHPGLGDVSSAAVENAVNLIEAEEQPETFIEQSEDLGFDLVCTVRLGANAWWLVHTDSHEALQNLLQAEEDLAKGRYLLMVMDVQSISNS